MEAGQPYRVYVDGIWDLFHPGHTNLLRQARQAATERAGGRTVELIAGVNGDGVETYKRKTVMDLAERCAAVAAHELVNRVVENCPLVLTREFLDREGIDLVVHGDDFSEEKRRLYYGAAVDTGRYASVPYTPGVSTTQLIREAVQGRFSIPMDQTRLDAAELVSRIQARSLAELKV